MAYIGKQPTVGNFVKLDAITATATTTFNLLNSGVAYFPQSPNHCLVSLNGILQAPTDSFTISGSTIIFSSALTTSDVIDFIIVLGDVLNIGTPSDNTVTAAKIVNSTIGVSKLSATGTPSSTTFLRGDNSWSEAGATAGTIIQVLSATDSSTRSSTTNQTWVTAGNTLSVSITPSSSNSKIFINAFLPNIAGDQGVSVTIFRNGSTNLGNATYGFFDTSGGPSNSISYLDSPATTSATTYQIYMRVTSGTTGFGLYASNYKATITCMEVKG